MGVENNEVNKFITDSLFMTITNANFDRERFVKRIGTSRLTSAILSERCLSSKGGKIEDIKYEGASGLQKILRRWNAKH